MSLLDDSRLKVERAKTHVLEFEQKIAVYDDVSIYRCFAEVDPNFGYQIHKIRVTEARRPKSLSPIVGDAVNNLREALDTACFSIARASTGIPDPRDCAFPFGRGVEQFEPNAKGKVQARGRCATLSEEWFTLFKMFEPYKGGNNLLWGLNELCIANKHKALTTFGVHAKRAESASIKYVEDSSFFVTFPPVKWRDSGNDQEIIVAISNVCPNLEIQCEFSFFVAFDEIEPVAHQEVVGILRKLTGIVESILLAMEAEARRIGLPGF